MTAVRYYGRKLDEERFTESRLGTVIRGLNRARAFVERVTEGAVAVYEARDQGIPVKPILRRLLEEGLKEPIDILVRPPVTASRTHAESQPSFEQRFYQGRDYSARVGRIADMRAREEPDLKLDQTMSLFTRYGRNGRRRGNRSLPPLVNETFRGVSDEA